MINITTDTGAKLEIGVASFKDCLKLKNVILSELSKVDIEIDKLDFASTDVNAILKPLLVVDSSEEVFEAVFKCAVRSKYNGEKITMELFEDTKAREDYYVVIIEVIKANLHPFFKGLASALKSIIPKNK